MEYLTSGFNIVLLIAGFGLLILVHELGHFLAAKWAGIRTEGFAVGMGPIMIAWRKGIGFKASSTAPDVLERTKKAPAALTDDELAHYGLGETEYSLRWLPIGGFVKMLGQDDTDPSYRSDDPRSYNRCPVWKRLVVVSAGVVMNLILAGILFLIAFMIGVRFEAPVIGTVAQGFPAATAVAENAEAQNITAIGLQPGDRVTAIDGSDVVTFADVQIAAAMSKPGTPLRITVEREEASAPLSFVLTPKKDEAGSGLLTIGVAPAASTQLFQDDDEGLVTRVLASNGLGEQGLKPGMLMTQAAGRPIETFQQYQKLVAQSDGAAIATVWVDPRNTNTSIDVDTSPVLGQQLLYEGDSGENTMPEMGMLGLTPLVELVGVPSTSHNSDVLEVGDVILHAGTGSAPRMGQFLKLVKSNAGQSLPMTILRDGKQIAVIGVVNQNGMLNVNPGYATDLPLIANPMKQLRSGPQEDAVIVDSPFVKLDLFGGTEIEEIESTPVSNWNDILVAVRLATKKANGLGQGAELTIKTKNPIDAQAHTDKVALSAGQVEALHQLAWRSELPTGLFEPVFVVRSASGNPITAIGMGVEETHKLILLTYLTIDRLFRRSIGIDQLHGPVGIVHLGTKVADRGYTFLIFFLAMISVNLAVINFLPLPILDGGLFLFLIYEKFKGRPPSVGFQNIATLVGLALILTVFVVTFYNDMARLLGT